MPILPSQSRRVRRSCPLFPSLPVLTALIIPIYVDTSLIVVGAIRSRIRKNSAPKSPNVRTEVRTKTWTELTVVCMRLSFMHDQDHAVLPMRRLHIYLSSIFLHERVSNIPPTQFDRGVPIYPRLIIHTRVSRTRRKQHPARVCMAHHHASSLSTPPRDIAGAVSMTAQRLTLPPLPPRRSRVACCPARSIASNAHRRGRPRRRRTASSATTSAGRGSRPG